MYKFKISFNKQHLLQKYYFCNSLLHIKTVFFVLQSEKSIFIAKILFLHWKHIEQKNKTKINYKKLCIICIKKKFN